MKKLYRSKTNRWIAGVCGGLGEYFGIDPIIVRLIFFVTSGLGGVYLLLWIFIPENPDPVGVKSSPSVIKTFLVILVAIIFLLIILPFIYFFVKSFFGV